MKKRMIITGLVFGLIAVAYLIINRVIIKDKNKHNIMSMTSGNSFGNDEDDDLDNICWIFKGDQENNRINNCYIKCVVESGGLMLTVYDNNGYSFIDNDKFIPVREEIISKSGEYYYDFMDIKEGIYSYCLTPKTIGDEVSFEFVVEFEDE